jgi:hypothetical protein
MKGTFLCAGKVRGATSGDMDVCELGHILCVVHFLGRIINSHYVTILSTE